MQQKQKHTALIFIVILFCAFTAASIALAALGINVYQITSDQNSRRELDAAALFFTQQVRACDDPSALRLATLSGTTPALVEAYVQNGKAMERWIFAENGMLKELLSEQGSTAAPDDSRDILPLKKADFRLVGDTLLEITMRGTDGDSYTMHLELPQDREVHHD